MGFNAVRVNICPSHIDSLPNLQRIKQHITWAKDNNLYLILAYFAPPGSISYKGYYTEWNFYNNEPNKEKFRQHWNRIMELCKDSNYSHVMYEFLNEPQICYSATDNDSLYRAYSVRNIYEGLMNDRMLTLNNQYKDGNRVVIIDGLSYAISDYRGFNYLYENLKQYKNIVYSFHYYMDDFVFRGCDWKTGDKYIAYKGYTTSNAEFDTIKFSFNVSALKGEKSPDIVLSPFDQKGRYEIKYFDITDNSNNSTVIKLDLQNKQVLEDSNGNYILDSSNNRRFGLGFKGNWGSATNSNMYMSNNSLVISNTVKQDTSVNIGENNYAVVSYSNSSWNYPFVLDESHIYTFKIIIDGDSLDDNGGFNIALKKNNDPNTILLQKYIRNLTGNNPDTNAIEKILSSHTDRINSAFNIMKDFSNKFNVPIFLGEFGIPIAQREPNTFKYFRNILDNIIQDSFNWAYFDYREPHNNYVSVDANEITFGLFSGIDSTPQTATVCKIVDGINTGITSDNLGKPYTYYYNKSLIDTLIKILNGSFVPTCNPVSLGIKKETIPNKYNLEQNYPNPFNPTTIINYSVPKSGFVTIKVFDVLGREVTTILNENKPAGNYKVEFNANKLTSGVYFYRMESGSYSQTNKLILLK
jgi:hypothetical protein